MTRVLLTFESLHKLLAAEKSLKQSDKNTRAETPAVRPTPTPANLSESVCGMSLEILKPEEIETVLARLEKADLSPAHVHELTD